TTALAPISTIRRAASSRSWSVRISMLVSASASGILGVTRKASPTNSVFIIANASSSTRRSPLFAIITGSTTSIGMSRSRMDAHTASTIAAFGSIPVLAACTPKSETTASICAVTRSAGSAWAIVTPSEFCAVTALMALVPYTPCAANVFRSAWMPAHAPESLPAIVSAIRMVVLIGWPEKMPQRGNESSGDRELDQIRNDERIHTREEGGAHPRRRVVGGAREEPQPGDARRVDHEQACEHRENGREVASIEAPFREVAGEKRGERICHEIATGRSEQTERSGRKRG